MTFGVIATVSSHSGLCNSSAYTTGNLRMCLEWYKVVCSIKVSKVFDLYVKGALETSLYPNFCEMFADWI